MYSVPFVLVFAFSLLNQQDRQGGALPLNNLLLMSGDSKLIAKVKDQYRYGVSMTEFEASLDKDRFVIQNWGKRGLVLIDKRLPMLVERESRRDLVKTLTEGVGPDWVVRVDDLPEAKRATFIEAIDEFFPWHSRPDGFNMNQAAVGLNLAYNVTVHEASGHYKNLSLPMPPAVAKVRNTALESHLMPQKGRQLTDEERARLARDGEARNAGLEKVEFHCFGAARTYLAEGLREAAVALERLCAELDLQTKQAAEELMKKVGFSPSISEVPKGRVRVEELPEAIRTQLMEQIGGSWRSWGFVSAQEAEQFVFGSTSVEVTISLGLRRTFTPYDKVTGRPSTGMVYNIVLIRP